MKLLRSFLRSLIVMVVVVVGGLPAVGMLVSYGTEKQDRATWRAWVLA